MNDASFYVACRGCKENHARHASEECSRCLGTFCSSCISAHDCAETVAPVQITALQGRPKKNGGSRMSSPAIAAIDKLIAGVNAEARAAELEACRADEHREQALAALQRARIAIKIFEEIRARQWSEHHGLDESKA